MRLSEVEVEHFRCFTAPTRIVLEDYATLVGANNCGKSTILHAIDLALSVRSPNRQDWPTTSSTPDTSKPIRIQLRFADVSEAESRIPGVAGIVHNDEIRIRYSAAWNDEKQKPEVELEAWTPQLETAWDSNAKFSELPADVQTAFKADHKNAAAWRSKSSRSKFEAKLADSDSPHVTRGAARWSSDSISIKTAPRQALPTPVIVPALRDPTRHITSTKQSTFGIILNSILLPTIKGSKLYKEVTASMERLSAALIEGEAQELSRIREIGDALSDRLTELLQNSTRADITIDPIELDGPLGNAFSVRLDDGAQTEVSYQGHGVQSTLVFALIELAAEFAQQTTEDSSGPRILLYEEPELYLHPHLMRRLRRALVKLSEAEGWQVVATTHSPFLVDVAEHPRSLVLFSRDKGGPPGVSQVASDPFEEATDGEEERMRLRAALDFHPSVAEAFFAATTVLVEGHTEVAVLQRGGALLRALSADPKAADRATIVSCGGKWTIPAVARVLDSLGLRFRVIHDQDAKARSHKELAALTGFDPYCANQRIASAAGSNPVFVVDDCIEDLLWEKGAGAASDKPYRAWGRINELLGSPKNLKRQAELCKLIEFAFDVN